MKVGKHPFFGRRYPSSWFFSPSADESERPVVFESRGTMGEELESLRTVIDDRRVYGDNGTDTHPKSPRRRKRFLSYPRYVELMVTADAKMVRHHGRNLEHYILTIMSVVSKIMFLKLFSFYSCGEDVPTFCLSVRALVIYCVSVFQRRFCGCTDSVREVL